ncbi:Terpene synthase family [Fusarium sp. NRRL 52700]|nr:Terpene synthase family [Fusarium sp. NRRL 52700]
MAQTISCNVFSAMASYLKGHTLSLPDLEGVVEKWPSGTNCNLSQLRVAVDEMLQRIIPNEDKRRAISESDFPLLTSRLFPDVGWCELKAATSLITWLFLWADKVHESDNDKAMSTESAQQYCTKCLREVRLSLDLDPVSKESEFNQKTTGKSGTDISVMMLFQDACDLLPLGTDRVQRERLFVEIELFMCSALAERSMDRSQVMPETEHYLKLRLLTAGMYPVLAILGHVCHIGLSESFMDLPPYTGTPPSSAELMTQVNNQQNAATVNGSSDEPQGRDLGEAQKLHKPEPVKGQAADVIPFLTRMKVYFYLFRNKLDTATKKLLFTVPLIQGDAKDWPDNLATYITMAIKIDEQQYERRREKAAYQRKGSDFNAHYPNQRRNNHQGNSRNQGYQRGGNELIPPMVHKQAL